MTILPFLITLYALLYSAILPPVLNDSITLSYYPLCFVVLCNITPVLNIYCKPYPLQKKKPFQPVRYNRTTEQVYNNIMQAEEIQVSPYNVRKALENTCTPIGSLPEDKLSNGHGLIQIDKAFEYVQTAADLPCIWYKISISQEKQAEYPNYTPLLAQILEGLISQEVEDKAHHYEEIVAAADEVADSIDTEELAKFLSINGDPKEEDFTETKKKMEKRPDLLVEALYQKGLALVEVASLKVPLHMFAAVILKALVQLFDYT
ncbi:putative tripeptidyl-peptidase II [Helianthus annuus]|nr:putative tripeptidyl-peptidase II [Helianthus annuus]